MQDRVLRNENTRRKETAMPDGIINNLKSCGNSTMDALTLVAFFACFLLVFFSTRVLLASLRAGSRFWNRLGAPRRALFLISTGMLLASIAAASLGIVSFVFGWLSLFFVRAMTVTAAVAFVLGFVSATIANPWAKP